MSLYIISIQKYISFYISCKQHICHHPHPIIKRPRRNYPHRTEKCSLSVSWHRKKYQKFNFALLHHNKCNPLLSYRLPAESCLKCHSDLRRRTAVSTRGSVSVIRCRAARRALRSSMTARGTLAMSSCIFPCFMPASSNIL